MGSQGQHQRDRQGHQRGHGLIMTKTLQALLKEDAIYDPETGHFSRARDNAKRKAGTKMGGCGTTKNGYSQVWWNGANQYAHRLAWLYVHGVLPQTIDHINGDRSDNRLANLRAATYAENKQNLPSKLKTSDHPIGASFDKSCGRWRADIKKNKRGHFLGYFDSPEAAHKAYLGAKKQTHAFNPIPREPQS